MRSLRATVLVLAAGLLSTQPAAAQERIINGSTPSQAWPAQTSVRFTTSSGTYVCGGTLVSARWVLTAGHCASDDSGAALAPSAFTLRVGSIYRTSGGHVSLVDAVSRHPSYDDATTPRFDLALLHLATSAPQEPLRIVATSAAENVSWGAGKPATIVGWGVTETGSASTTLREAAVPMMGDSSCALTWGSYFSATSMVCAGGASSDTCSGDSGGPLMVPRGDAFSIVGVTSWGTYPCASAGVPAAYARLGAPAINAWVKSIVPTVSFTASTQAPAASAPVSFSASIGAAPGTPVLSWDTNADGVFNDGAGATASAAFAAPGAHVVKLQAVYADGDRAVAREVITVSGVPATIAPPPPPPLPPPPPAPPRSAPPIEPSTPATGTVSAPARIKLATLRSKNLRVRFTCTQACSASGRLTLGAASASRVGLGGSGRMVTVASGTADLDEEGSRVLTVRLTARAKRALRKATRVKFSLRTELVLQDRRLPMTASVLARR